MTKKHIKSQKEQDKDYKPNQKKFCYKRRCFSVQKCNKSYWSIDEQNKYKDFLNVNKELFIDQKTRKQSKIFARMSLQIKKRSPDQCRSHHQKMIIKYKDIDSIIAKIEKESQQQQRNQINLEKKQEKTGMHKEIRQKINMSQFFENSYQTIENKGYTQESIEQMIEQQESVWKYLSPESWMQI